MSDDAVGAARDSRPPVADILDKLKDAENRVKAIIKDAEMQREKILSEGKREIIEIKERSANEVAGMIDRMSCTVNATIESERKRIFEKSEADVRGIREAAKSKMGQAKDYLLKEFMRAIDDQA